MYIINSCWKIVELTDGISACLCPASSNGPIWHAPPTSDSHVGSQSVFALSECSTICVLHIKCKPTVHLPLQANSKVQCRSKAVCMTSVLRKNEIAVYTYMSQRDRNAHGIANSIWNWCKCRTVCAQNKLCACFRMSKFHSVFTKPTEHFTIPHRFTAMYFAYYDLRVELNICK